MDVIRPPQIPIVVKMYFVDATGAVGESTGVLVRQTPGRKSRFGPDDPLRLEIEVDGRTSLPDFKPKPVDFKELTTESMWIELERRKHAVLLDGKCDYCEKPLKSVPSCAHPERHNKCRQAVLVRGY